MQTSTPASPSGVSRRAALLTLLFCGLTGGRARAAAETPPAVIRMGSGAASASFGRGVSGGVPGWVVNQKTLEQEFAGENATFEWSHIPTAGPGVNEALASGSLDFGYYGDFPALIGRAGGLPTKLIVPGQRGSNSALIVPLDSKATSIRDLLGKRIAYQRGRPWELAFTRLLAVNNLTEADFQIFNLTDPDGQTALLAGGVDAEFGSDTIIVDEKHAAKTIWSTQSQPITWRSTADLFVTDAFAKQYPETTKRVAKAFVRAAYTASLDENRDAVFAVWAQGSGGNSARFALQYQGVPLRESFVPLIDPFLIQHYRDAVSYTAKAHLIRKPFNVDEWIDPSFLKAALAELNLEHFWTALDVDGQPLPSAR